MLELKPALAEKKNGTSVTPLSINSTNFSTIIRKKKKKEYENARWWYFRKLKIMNRKTMIVSSLFVNVRPKLNRRFSVGKPAKNQRNE